MRVYRRAHMSRLSICAITVGKRFRAADAWILARMLQHNTVLTTLDLSGMCERAHELCRAGAIHSARHEGVMV